MNRPMSGPDPQVAGFSQASGNFLHPIAVFLANTGLLSGGQSRKHDAYRSEFGYFR